jgi:hypothetical protein
MNAKSLLLLYTWLSREKAVRAVFPISLPLFSSQSCEQTFRDVRMRWADSFFVCSSSVLRYIRLRYSCRHGNNAAGIGIANLMDRINKISAFAQLVARNSVTGRMVFPQACKKAPSMESIHQEAALFPDDITE